MGNEQIFRLILIVGFASVTSVGLYYRIRSHTGEKLDRQQEGALVLVGLRLIALVWFAGVIAYMIKPRWMSWASVSLPVWLRWFGVGIAMLSTAFKSWTFHALGRNLTDTVVTRQEHALVTSGPYRWVRHPFYTSFAMDVIGVSLLTGNWSLLISGALAIAVIVARTGKEEAKLFERFGEEYKCYAKQVGRFLPRPK